MSGWGLWAAAAVAGYFVVFGLLVAATRPRHPHAAGPSMDYPGDEPPALVNFLTSGWRVTRDAVPATLVDLAAREFVEIQHVAPGEFVVRIDVTDDEGVEELTPYERQVLDHVRSLAAHGAVPGDALTTGPPVEAGRWWKQFQGAVVDDARARGWTRPRWRGPELLVLMVVASAAALVVGRFVSGLDADQSHWAEGFYASSVATVVLLLLPLVAVRQERDTPKGLAVAGRWLGLRRYLDTEGSFVDQEPGGVVVWGRYLAYGAAMGLARGVLREMPMGAESPYVAWSPYGGEWHIVRVSYPRVWPPGWGYAPIAATIIGFIGASFAWFIVLLVGRPLAGVFLDGLRGTSEEFEGLWLVFGGITLIPLAAFTAAGLYFTAMFLVGVSDIGRRRTVSGIVVRTKDVESTQKNRTTIVRRYIALDDGQTREVRALSGLYEQLAHVDNGNLVSAVVSPRLGYIDSITVVPKARASG